MTLPNFDELFDTVAQEWTCSECGGHEYTTDCYDGDNFENQCDDKCSECGYIS